MCYDWSNRVHYILDKAHVLRHVRALLSYNAHSTRHERVRAQILGHFMREIKVKTNICDSVRT